MFRFVLAWEDFKDWLSHAAHLSHWDLHVIVGLALLLAVCLFLRRPPVSFLLLLPIATLEALNEVSDFTRYYVAGWPWEGRATAMEVALTLGPPMLVIIAARLVPAWKTSPKSQSIAVQTAAPSNAASAPRVDSD